MAQGLFYGGSGCRAVAHTRPAFPKMPTAPSAFPLLGAPQAPGDEPNLPEGSKSLGGRPPEAERNYPAAETHPARSAPLPARSTEVWPNNWRSTVLLQLQRYLLRAPPNGQVWHKAFFYGGSGRRAVAHTRPAFPKMPTAPSAFPLLGAPQAPGDEPNLPEGSKSLGGRPPEAEGNYPAAETHPARSAPLPARSAEVRPNNWRSTVLIQLQRYLLRAPPNGQVWHKAFFMVGPDAGP